jgi:hypothetical protein
MDVLYEIRTTTFDFSVSLELHVFSYSKTDYSVTILHSGIPRYKKLIQVRYRKDCHTERDRLLL